MSVIYREVHLKGTNDLTWLVDIWNGLPDHEQERWLLLSGKALNAQIQTMPKNEDTQCQIQP